MESAYMLCTLYIFTCTVRYSEWPGKNALTYQGIENSDPCVCQYNGDEKDVQKAQLLYSMLIASMLGARHIALELKVVKNIG